MKKESTLARLFTYAGSYKYLTICHGSCLCQCLIALLPFYYIWRIMQEVLNWQHRITAR